MSQHPQISVQCYIWQTWLTSLRKLDPIYNWAGFSFNRLVHTLCRRLKCNIFRLPEARTQGGKAWNQRVSTNMPWLGTNNPHTAWCHTERQQRSLKRSLHNNTVHAKAKLNILSMFLISERLLSYMSVPFRVIPVFKKSFAILLHTASRFTKW